MISCMKGLVQSKKPRKQQEILQTRKFHFSYLFEGFALNMSSGARIGVNGFGRIGRLVVRAAFEKGVRASCVLGSRSLLPLL